MIWQPYTSELLVSPVDVCVRDQHVWRTIAPLICFDIVEWHHPDRVLRQFGLQQGIPMQCETEAAGEKSIVTTEPKENTMHYHDPYMKWYISITRHLITPLTQRPHKRIRPASGMSHLLVHSLTNIHNQCTATLGAFTNESAMQSLTDI
ncbi:hypothetical protein Patl1_14730 [Pistacia atlantica]|uniref:Uncharacterized protein n=1 Tax=Pistacia atlantica TaxID=434234 RepID=A0ACC1AU39_9ROSI|nr:hypothetical protein Patl1_14730 [Pistacia atlantica]